MKTSEQEELIDFLGLNREMTPEEKRKLALCEEYKKKFGEPFAYIWGFHRDKTKFPTDEDMIEYCLKKGKPMRKLYPRWYEKNYPKKGIYFEQEVKAN